jgi:hypothetical protein
MQITSWRYVAGIVLMAGCCLAQKDPGPRGGPAGAGSAFPRLSTGELAMFGQSQGRFLEVDSVSAPSRRVWG